MFHIIHDNEVSAANAVAVFGTKASALVPYAHRHPAIELLGLIN